MSFVVSQWKDRARLWMILPVLAVGAGCGDEVDSLAELERELAELPALSEMPDGVAVSGSVRFVGEAPDPTVVRLLSDASCHLKGSGAIEAEDVLIGDDGEIENVFLWIRNFEQRFAPPSREVLLDQVGCEYTPRVFGIMVGQTLRIRNSDETLHNVRLDADSNRKFNIGQPVKGMETTRSFDNAELMVNFECDVHPWMDAWGGVLYHPLFGVTDDEGRFRIEGVPPGQWELGWWHERIGEGSLEIEVGAESVSLEPIILGAPPEVG